ncbi:sulfatase-like hydrolase/transferase [Haloferula sp. A504]|uniref:sulfatase-like hydrolase/transferase n=1 Tax=Haloferula sp. A504 TaxID=3373601 RepID=UPI0031BDDE4E|nr:sulfatase-like hydrolase/transferase [Verrucomicrobiaceae bacterium E54]
MIRTLYFHSGVETPKHYMSSSRCFALLLACPLLACAADRPNVLLIYGDDVGYGDVGAYGAEKIPTPNIDRLASEGLRFTDGHCASSTCTPSRYSLLTGELPLRKERMGIAHGLSNMIVSPDQFTLADLFKAVGYRTAVIGKWHLGLDDEPIDWNGRIEPGPESLGFDHHFIIPATNDRLPTVYVEDGGVVGLDPDDPITVRRGSYEEPIPDSVAGTPYPIALLEPDAVTAYPGDHAHSGSVINGIGRIGKMKGGKSALFKDEDIADDLVREATAFIRESGDEPFFLYFSANDIHAPRWPHSRFRGKSDHGLRGDAMVSFDWSAGALLGLLDELGLAKDTLVILTSDNGPVYIDGGYLDGCKTCGSGGADHGHFAAGPYRGGKYQIYEGGTRVPFIVRWPGRVDPGVSDALFSQVDLLGSLSSLLGVEIPPGQAADSRDFVNALTGKDSKGADWIVTCSFKDVAIRHGEWKYVSDPPQLFNLREDPGERDNAIGDHPKKVAEMQALLERVRARSSRSGTD